jgi:hypothetical protein
MFNQLLIGVSKGAARDQAGKSHGAIKGYLCSTAHCEVSHFSISRAASMITTTTAHSALALWALFISETPKRVGGAKPAKPAV